MKREYLWRFGCLLDIFATVSKYNNQDGPGEVTSRDDWLHTGVLAGLYESDYLKLLGAYVEKYYSSSL